MSASLGRYAALAVFLIGLSYLVTLAAGMAFHGLSEPIADPILAVMEVLTLVSAPPMVILMAAIHAQAPPDRRVCGLIALAFTIVFAGTTSAVPPGEKTAYSPLSRDVACTRLRKPVTYATFSAVLATSASSPWRSSACVSRSAWCGYTEPPAGGC